MDVKNWAVAFVGAAVLSLTACGSSSDDAADPSTSVVPSTAAVSTVTVTSPPPVVTTASDTTLVPETTPVVDVVGEGVACSWRGATAVFSDGAVAYCARLAGTDALVWSRNATVAPNPALGTSTVSAGTPCHGYQTGSYAYDASGTQLICTDYMWQVNVGQRPKTDWGDGQREWAECLESNTQAECRRRLNR